MHADTRVPTQTELQQLQRMDKAYRLWPRKFISLLPLYFLSIVVFKDSPLLLAGIVLILIAVFVWGALHYILLRRCPRCAAWGTIPKGSCGQCGLYLDPNRHD